LYAIVYNNTNINISNINTLEKNFAIM